MERFFELGMKDWMLCNLSHNLGKEFGDNWATFFGFACWLVWLNRNMMVFERRLELVHTITLKARMGTKEVSDIAKTLRKGGDQAVGREWR